MCNRVYKSPRRDSPRRRRHPPRPQLRQDTPAHSSHHRPAQHPSSNGLRLQSWTPFRSRSPRPEPSTPQLPRPIDPPQPTWSRSTLMGSISSKLTGSMRSPVMWSVSIFAVASSLLFNLHARTHADRTADSTRARKVTATETST